MCSLYHIQWVSSKMLIWSLVDGQAQYSKVSWVLSNWVMKSSQSIPLTIVQLAGDILPCDFHVQTHNRQYEEGGHLSGLVVCYWSGIQNIPGPIPTDNFMMEDYPALCSWQGIPYPVTSACSLKTDSDVGSPKVLADPAPQTQYGQY